MGRTTTLALALLLVGCSGRVSGPPVCDGLWGEEEATIDAPFDQDRDGFFDASDPGCVATYPAVDCNDLRAEISPGAQEALCNGVDEDCDPATPDVGDVDEDGVNWCTDCDDEDPAANFTDLDGDGVSPCEGDCDESDPAVRPGVADPPNDGVDQDCTPTPPRLAGAAVTNPLGASQAAVASVQVDDDEDIDVAVTWRWTVNGLDVADETTDTLPAAAFVLGDAVRAWATADDGTFRTEEHPTDEVVVTNSAPSYGSVAIDPANPGSNAILSLVLGGFSDPDGDPEGPPDVQWYVDGGPIGLDQLTLDPAAFGRGQTVTVAVRAFDGLDHGPEQVSAPAVVGNGAPTAPTLVVGPDLPTTADPLTCAVDQPGVDPDGDPVAYTWSWLRDGAPTPFNVPEVPAFTLNEAETWTCIATPNDGAITGTPGQATLTVLSRTTFVPTGADQSWAVPAGVTQVLVKAWGGAGGGSNAEGVQFGGGAGGYAEGVVATTPGETWTVLVGEGGHITSNNVLPAYPAGGAPTLQTGYFQGGGGGRTAVVRAGVELLVAAGGGGAGCSGWVASVGAVSTQGGEGGGSVGGDGDAATPDSTSHYACAGKGATPFAGGAGGFGPPCDGNLGIAGARNQGADGPAYPGVGDCGGAGGDGFYGGGSGALHAGGGGGSSYLHPTDVSDGVLLTEPASGAPADDDPDWTPGTSEAAPGGDGGGGLLVIWH